VRLNTIARPRGIAALIVFAAALLPAIPDPPERNAGADIDLVRSTVREYRGMKTSFDELTRAYALEVYGHPELMAGRHTPIPDTRKPELW